MEQLRIDTEHIRPFCKEDCLNLFSQPMAEVHQTLTARSGKGNDFLGWIDLPDMPEDIIRRIESDARAIREMADILVVVGIGGSYLGARAVIEALTDPFQCHLRGVATRVLFAGENLSGPYHAALLRLLDNRDYAVAVISKSGTTTEPAIAFRLLKNHLEKKYGKADAARRIFAITDSSRGALKKMATREGYASYVIPDDVGGRYSVLTPVGLLPVAAAGIDIRQMIAGAALMAKTARSSSTYNENPCLLYAAIRNILYRNGKHIELLVSYEPGMMYLIEWWKQLFGESEGKEGKGIFPAGVTFTTDLHSMGQYIQEGMRILFETVVCIEKTGDDLMIPEAEDNTDGLNYLAGKSVSFVNRMAEKATTMAHVDGKVPVVRILLPSLNAFYIGQLIYFFEYSCALSGYALGVNPFDQPGVEAYKNNMFTLLGKPGF